MCAASRDMPNAAYFLDIILDDFEHIEIDTSDLECFYMFLLYVSCFSEAGIA